MIGLLLMLIGFPALIVGIVFLFFQKLLTKGFIVILISVFFILFGFKECSKFHLYPTDEELRLQDIESEKQELIVAKKSAEVPLKQANKQIQEEIDKYKKKLVGDSIDFYLKNTNDLRISIHQFEKSLIVDMNSSSKLNYPFKDFEFGNLAHFKNQTNWINCTKFIAPIDKELVHVSGILSNDSNSVTYDGYLNLKTRIIYWTSFNPKEIIVKNWKIYTGYPSELLKLIKASKEVKIEFLYWVSQSEADFVTERVWKRKDQRKNFILFEGKFIPFYKVNQVKGHGEIILRKFYKF